MHDTAMAIGAAVIAEFASMQQGTIVEIGAMDINGSLRATVPPGIKYIGIDREPGPGVDLVVGAGKRIPLEASCADLVIASSVFEHDFRFWDTFRTMCRLAKPRGHIYLNVPSNGSVHGYPVDCWRFYPDAGLALERHSRTSRWPVRLIESFIAERLSDQWNDFVAIFERTSSSEPTQRTGRIYRQFDARNIYDIDSQERLAPETWPQDIRLWQKARQEALQQQANYVGELAKRDAHVTHLEGQLEARESAHPDVRSPQLSQTPAGLIEEITELREENDKLLVRGEALERALAQTRKAEVRLQQDLVRLDNRIVELELELKEASLSTDSARLPPEGK